MGLWFQIKEFNRLDNNLLTDMDTYKFNDVGICTNPETLLTYKDKGVKLRMRYFTDGENCSVTVDVQTPYSGSGSAPSKRRLSKSVDSAVDSAFAYANEFLNDTLTDTNSCKPKYLDTYVHSAIKYLDSKYKVLSLAHKYNLNSFTQGDPVWVQSSLF